MRRRSVQLLVLLVVLVIINGCAFSKRGAQRMYKHWAENKSYDIVIVPGMPMNDSMQWGRLLRGRVYWAKYLFDKGVAKNIMFSGSAVYSPYYEAEVMSLYAQAIGIPKENIFTETKAEHSTENLYYSYKKAKSMGFETIALASDHFQTKMLKNFAHLRISRSIGIIPFVIDTLNQVEVPNLNPEIDYKQAEKENFVALPERENRWKRLKGTLGWNIDKTAYE